jgi:flagellar protein FliS
MSYNAQSAKYREADVLSRPREWLVPLLYEHLLVSLRRASVQIEGGDLEGKAASLERGSAILFELLSSLDMERGGELAERLGALYRFFAGELLTVGRTLDRERLERIIHMVADLHDGWVQAAQAVQPRPAISA